MMNGMPGAIGNSRELFDVLCGRWCAAPTEWLCVWSCVVAACLWLAMPSAARADSSGTENAPPASSTTTLAIGAVPELARAPAWSQGQPAPLGYTVVEQRRWGRIIGGSLLFGLGYVPLLSVSVSATEDGFDDERILAVPVIGALSLVGESCNGVGCAAKGLGILSATLQISGAIVLVSGIPKRQVLVRDHLAMSVVPVMVSNSEGDQMWLMATGQF